MVSQELKPRADGARDIGAEMDLDAGRLRLGALGFDRAVEKKLGRAVGRDQRDAMALENAEIGAVAQIVALPGIAVEHHRLDAGLSHGTEQTSAAFLSQHAALYSAALSWSGS
jgi:hypothetical protein